MPNPPVTPQPPSRTTARSGQHGISGGFGRLFPTLKGQPWDPISDPGQDVEDVLDEIAQKLFGDGEPHPTLPSAYTFLGQFVAHDLVFDARPELGSLDGAVLPVNRRSPRFDLECIYGGGPFVHPHLYSVSEHGQFLIGKNRRGELDVPRNDDASLDGNQTTDLCRWRRALVADQRNDQHTVISQLHLAFLLLHNRIASVEGRSFEEAQKLTRWHYQRLLIEDFLPRLCGEEIVNAILPGGGPPKLKRFKPKRDDAWIPYEFSFAAYRLGHSMLGSTYRLSEGLDRDRNGRPLRLFAFGNGSRRARERHAAHTLDGERMLPQYWTIQWDRFLSANPADGGQPAQRIDAKIARPVASLPLPGQSRRARSLPYRTLHRGLSLGLPQGQAVASLLGVSKPLPGNDSLWVYILKEAAQNPAHVLGEVGATIVAETFIGLMWADSSSYLHAADGFDSEFETDSCGFDLRSLLEHAGVPITAQDWDAAVNR
jgi:hypothetical protein